MLHPAWNLHAVTSKCWPFLTLGTFTPLEEWWWRSKWRWLQCLMWWAVAHHQRGHSDIFENFIIGSNAFQLVISYHLHQPCLLYEKPVATMEMKEEAKSLQSPFHHTSYFYSPRWILTSQWIFYPKLSQLTLFKASLSSSVKLCRVCKCKQNSELRQGRQRLFC